MGTFLNRFPVTQKANASPRRSITKTLTWRMIAEVDTFIISYLITGSINLFLQMGWASASDVRSRRWADWVAAKQRPGVAPEPGADFWRTP